MQHQTHIKLLSLMMVTVMAATCVAVITADDQSEAAIYYGGSNTSSSTNPYTGFSSSVLDTVGIGTVYIEEGSYFSLYNLQSVDYGNYGVAVTPSGSGLSVTETGDREGDNLEGRLNTPGTYTILCSGENDAHSFKITVISSATPVTSVSISGSTSGEVGESITLTATTSPSSADNRHVTWSITSGSSYASIRSQTDTSTGGRCVIDLEGSGSVTVRATADDGSGEYDTHTIRITEPEILVSSVSISGNTSMEVGDAITLTATTSPSNADDRSVDWSVISGSSHVRISESSYSSGGRCTVTALSAGTVTIRATASDGSGEYDTYTITITEPVVLTSSVSISGSTSVAVGSSITLTATTSPSNADDRHVTWSVTSGSGHVTYTISNTSTGGTITLTGVSAGSVTVRATASDGSEASDTHTFTVYTPEVEITSSHGDVTIVTGQEFSSVIQTNVSGCTISVAGADWLNVSGSTVSGTPSTAGEYNVTITASHSGYTSDTISFTITVVSALGFDSVPTNGVTVYVVS